MSTTNSRLWPVLTALAGLGSLAITVAFRMLDAVKAAGACMTDGSVIAFEFADTPAKLAAVFGSEACTPLVIAGMDAVNRLDIAAYIPAYTAFAICAAIWLAGRAWAPLALAAIAAALVACTADLIETITLLQITKDLVGAEPMLPRAAAAAWTKFFALAVHALVLAVICMRASPRRLILGGLLVLPIVGATLAWLDQSRTGLMTLGFVLSWTPMLLVAIREAVWPRKA
jgi:hypothetical protein